MTKKASEKKSPDQINLSFKNNEEEKKLYAWLKQKLNPGIFLKEIAYREYLVEIGKLQYVPTQNQTVYTGAEDVSQEHPEPAKTVLVKNDYGFADDDEDDE